MLVLTLLPLRVHLHLGYVVGGADLNFLAMGVWGIYLTSAIIGIVVGLHEWRKRDEFKSSLTIKRVFGAFISLLSLSLLFWLINIPPFIDMVHILLFSLFVSLIVSFVATVGMIFQFSDSN